MLDLSFVHQPHEKGGTLKIPNIIENRGLWMIGLIVLLFIAWYVVPRVRAYQKASTVCYVSVPSDLAPWRKEDRMHQHREFLKQAAEILQGCYSKKYGEDFGLMIADHVESCLTVFGAQYGCKIGRAGETECFHSPDPGKVRLSMTCLQQSLEAP